MNAIKLIVGMIVAAGAVVAINTATAGASSNVCDVAIVKKTTQWGSTFKVNGDKITSTFKVNGKNCKTAVTVAVWKAPAATGLPLHEQKLFSHVTKTFGPGTYSLTTTLPDCYYQADLLRGSNPKAADGTSNYVYPNGQYLQHHPLRDFTLGGDKKCDQPKPQPPKDVCPNIEGNQAEVPEGHEIDEKGNCVVPKEPEAPKPEKPKTPEVKGEQAPTELPQTGAGAVAATFMGISTSAGIAHAIVRRFKK